ncbi:MAG: SMI1/KNR4 family protein [Saprospirales bacterium]|nr:SMI1/KNR4 family protein [Saprospirales bacterium]
MIEEPNEFGKLSAEKLKQFEKSNSFQLPEDYKQFLLKYNGGTPLKPYLKEKDTNISCFFGLADEPDWFSLTNVIEDLAGRIPGSFIPIADDSFGKLILKSLALENYGEIFSGTELEAQMGR